MLNGILSWAGGGLILIIIYFLISNTLWLLFGSKILQLLPGINNKTTAGTAKIATMITLSVLGTLVWMFKYVYFLVFANNVRPVFKDEVGKMIQWCARIYYR